ncbi:MAG: hypothetical protein AB1705_05040 [Verrucomicrobiota bacterium]
MMLASFSYDSPPVWMFAAGGVLALALLRCIVVTGRTLAGAGTGLVGGFLLPVWVFAHGDGDMTPLMMLAGGIYGAAGGAVAGGIGGWIGRLWRRTAEEATSETAKARPAVGTAMRVSGWVLLLLPLATVALFVMEVAGLPVPGVSWENMNLRVVLNLPLAGVAGLFLLHAGGWVRGRNEPAKL